jgi:uncharacterized Zn-binding protein involved in type VI secretion
MNSLRKKGQAALEFLTTYGWAFMLILVCIGALAYFGILSPGKLVPDKCVASVGFNCIDSVASISSGDSLAVVLTANRGTKISITDLKVDVKGTDVATSGGCGLYDQNDVPLPLPAEIVNTQKFMMKCTNFKETLNAKKGDRLEATITFNYALDGGLSHAAHISSTGVFR